LDLIQQYYQTESNYFVFVHPKESRYFRQSPGVDQKIQTQQILCADQ